MSPYLATRLAAAAALGWIAVAAASEVPVCTAPQDQRRPSVVPDGAGGAIVVWEDLRGGDPDIYAQHVLAAGGADPAWPADGVAVCVAEGMQLAPAAASDGAGGVIVAWEDYRGLSFIPSVYAQRVLALGMLDPQWPAGGRALCPATQDQAQPVIVADGAGGAIVGWADGRAGSLRDIYAQRVLSSGVVDPAWPGSALAVCVADWMQYSLAIASDGAGGAILGWEDERSVLVSGSDIYAHHVLPTGVVDAAWPADGRPVCIEGGSQRFPVMTPDGAGGAVLAWDDFRNGTNQDANWDVYAQRVLATGTVDPDWPAGGRALCNAPGLQWNPVLVPDQAGGAVVAWSDGRGADDDVYAGRVLGTGLADPDWPADGLAICLAAGDQASPSIATDGEGGAIVAWHDFRNDSLPDIYAHHVRVSGTLDPAWAADGEAISIAPQRQQYPAMVSDDAHGALLAWQDRRGGADWDIYSAGTPPAVVGASGAPSPTGFLLDPPAPNPAGTGTLIRFALPRTVTARLAVHDPAGRRVRVLAEGLLPPGRHSVRFEFVDASGRRLPSGAYLVTLEAGGRRVARRFVALR